MSETHKIPFWRTRAGYLALIAVVAAAAAGLTAHCSPTSSNARQSSERRMSG